MDYEWSDVKAAANLEKHDVSFDEAATVFLDSLALSGPDPDHSDEEDRYITFGHSRDESRPVAVCMPHLSPGHDTNHYRPPRSP